jgi:HrpA-like RNA helicase
MPWGWPGDRARYDALNKMPMLVETFISKAAARQRRGRAGRVRPGVCYHMFSSKVANSIRAATDTFPHDLLP